LFKLSFGEANNADFFYGHTFLIIFLRVPVPFD